MAARDATRGVPDGTTARTAARGRGRRVFETETRRSFKTTELLAYIGTLVAILIAGAAVNNGPNGLGARQVWLYATILTAGYMISRGLAKSGSFEKEFEETGDDARLGRDDRPGPG
jgi:hypothetical protein